MAVSMKTKAYKTDICYLNDYKFIDCFKQNYRIKMTAMQALYKCFKDQKNCIM